MRGKLASERRKIFTNTTTRVSFLRRKANTFIPFCSTPFFTTWRRRTEIYYGNTFSTDVSLSRGLGVARSFPSSLFTRFERFFRFRNGKEILFSRGWKKNFLAISYPFPFHGNRCQQRFRNLAILNYLQSPMYYRKNHLEIEWIVISSGNFEIQIELDWVYTLKVFQSLPCCPLKPKTVSAKFPPIILWLIKIRIRRSLPALEHFSGKSRKITW